MTISNSPLAFSDCYKVYDQAIADRVGVRIQFAGTPEGRDAAFHFRMRLHQARKINRSENKITYAIGAPLYGRSIYDVLIVRIRHADGAWWVYLERSAIKLGVVESLSSGSVLALEHRPVRALPPPRSEPVDDLPEDAVEEEFQDTGGVPPVEMKLEPEPEPEPKPISRRGL